MRRELPERCERCDQRKPLERHHIDEDTGNNKPENLAALCRRCHMEVDGRLAAFVTLPKRKAVPPKPCAECERLAKPLRKGLCGACYERKRRRGECHDAEHGL